MYAKSFSCLTQPKAMLGRVELWLSWGFDNLKPEVKVEVGVELGKRRALKQNFMPSLVFTIL